MKWKLSLWQLTSPLQSATINNMKDKYMSQNKYDANNTRKFGLKLNRKTDKEIIEKLESVDSIQGYIKSLIRADIEKEKR